MKIISIILLITLTAPFVYAQKDFFPFSVWYSGGKARAPMLSQIHAQSEEEWRKDLQQIKSLGFNTVRTWVEWAKCEPQKGEYHFENLELLLKLAGEMGLKVFIQIYVDSAPDWVATEFPHALFEAQSGDKVQPQAAPGACTDNPEVQKAVTDFYSKVAEIASQYEHFTGWDLWSEPHIINWASLDYIPNVQFCFCPGTRQKFRSWLENKYQNIENLNAAWYRNFNSWSQVDPPRFSTILSYTDFIDWKSFIYEKLVDDMAMRYEAIRKNDPSHLITAHAVGASLFQSPHVGAGATDDFLMSRPLDYYGVSLYPKHNHPDRAWSTTTLRTVMDFTRSANREKKGWFVGELQAGMGTISLLVSDPVTPQDHNLWAWSAIAKGAKGVNIYAYYPMSTGYEAGGYGLINLDGTLTERAKNAGQIAQVVNKHMDLFLQSQPVPAKIGIVYNPLTQMVGGMQRRDYPAALANSLIGYFQILANHNIPVDFIHREHLEKNEVSDYQLIIVPYPIMLTSAAAEGLKKFEANGGYVMAEARIGWNDDKGHSSPIIPGLGLHEMFGVRENEVRMREKINLLPNLNINHRLLQNLTSEDTLAGTLYAETFSALSGKNITVLANSEDGQPLITLSNRALMVGSYLGMADFPNISSANEKFLLNVTKWAEIEKPVSANTDGRQNQQIELRLHETENLGKLLFVINHSSTAEKLDAVIKNLETGKYLCKELTTGKTISLNSQSQNLTLPLEIDPREAEVWWIQKEI